MVVIKGHEFDPVIVRDSYNRRALQYQNKIITCLKKFKLTKDDIEIPMEPMAMKRAQASVSWYALGEHLFFSYNKSKFVENLAMIVKVIEYFVQLLENDVITQEEFIALFVEEPDILEQRKEARELLGVEEDSTDFETMHKNYKKLSKEHHPDMPNGDTETFKKLNHAHKMLKREFN